MQIQIIQTPIIFTKDNEWVKQQAGKIVKGGDIILLPEDAILIVSHETPR